MQINHNGLVLPADTPIFTAQNRSFRYGDGLFESIRAFDGRLPFFHYHWQRLMAGLSSLGIEKPPYFSPDFFQNEIAKLTNNQGNWRIRLTVWRSGGGLYTPATNQPEFLIEAVPFSSSRFELNEGLRIGVFPSPLLPTANLNQSTPDNPQFPNFPISNFKLTSALPYVLAAQYKQANGLDHSLLLNTAGRLACANSANIFWVKNGRLFTPPLSEGCVAGTMRAILFDIAKATKIKVQEKKGRLADLAEAEEVFLTNAIQGIRWVKEIQGMEQRYGHELVKRLVTALNEKMEGLRAFL
ncbi:MAG: aminotransferase class IV [Saprospiraceae bacterium]|nr:aminotransferase class IV [Saprospiraceae bacterium]